MPSSGDDVVVVGVVLHVRVPTASGAMCLSPTCMALLPQVGSEEEAKRVVENRLRKIHSIASRQVVEQQIQDKGAAVI